jgi:hypothetical protein
MKGIRAICLAIALVASIFSSCNTYFIAASNAPVNIYSADDGANVVYNVPVGSVLLLKGKVNRYGLTRVRYHSDRSWYWVNYMYLSFVPNANPKYYDLTYRNLEFNIVSSKGGSHGNTNTSSSSYDAIIQEGSRGGKYYINKNGNKTYVPRSTPAGSTRSVRSRGNNE